MKINRNITYSLCLLLLVALLSVNTAAVATKESEEYGECNGKSMEECGRIIEEEEEEEKFLMGSLAGGRTISPGALKADAPVCRGGRGQPYSSTSCLPPPSNPPQRGCPMVYMCRS